jgi:hypothetical protein
VFVSGWNGATGRAAVCLPDRGVPTVSSCAESDDERPRRRGIRGQTRPGRGRGWTEGQIVVRTDGAHERRTIGRDRRRARGGGFGVERAAALPLEHPADPGDRGVTLRGRPTAFGGGLRLDRATAGRGVRGATTAAGPPVLGPAAAGGQPGTRRNGQAERTHGLAEDDQEQSGTLMDRHGHAGSTAAREAMGIWYEDGNGGDGSPPTRRPVEVWVVMTPTRTGTPWSRSGPAAGRAGRAGGRQPAGRGGNVAPGHGTPPRATR